LDWNTQETQTDLMKKGLRRDAGRHLLDGLETQTDLMKKGLRRRQQRLFYVLRETQTDLMKKGLRPCTLATRCLAGKHRQT